ncbi:MAG: hypothetical protein GYA50_08590 [Eubacteriaceae bacterium]|nr:hypothetical protein [Eubacteriaceae bacterium]
MSQHYNRNYAKKEIEFILDIIIDCINKDHYIISKNKNRKENTDFINKYNLNSTKQKEILLSIKVEDFCHSLQNAKPGYEYETLYVFCLQKKLFSIDDKEEVVDIYIKFNIIDYDSGKYVVTISFHK